MFLKAVPYDLGFNRNIMLVSPVVGLIGAMSLPMDELKFEHGCVYKVLAVYLPDSSRALRYIRSKEKCFWALRARFVALIPQHVSSFHSISFSDFPCSLSALDHSSISSTSIVYARELHDRRADGRR